MILNWFFVLAICVSSISFAQDMEQQFYYLKISSNNAEIHAYLNGFPVYNINSEGQITNQVPVNLALIGKDNRLLIKTAPLGDNAMTSGSIALYKGSEVVSTNDQKEPIVSFEIDIVKPENRVFTFDNDRFDFSKVLIDSEPLDDTSALADYAMKLRGWVNQKDIQALLEQMEPKIDDYAEAYSVSADVIRQSLQESFTSDLFNVDWQEVKREEIVPVPYCDGRMWELTVSSDHRPLFFSETEEGSTALQVYVASINGELRVVR